MWAAWPSGSTPAFSPRRGRRKAWGLGPQIEVFAAALRWSFRHLPGPPVPQLPYLYNGFLRKAVMQEYRLTGWAQSPTWLVPETHGSFLKDFLETLC